MYTLKIKDRLFYKYGIAELALTDIKVSLELNTAGLLDFEIPPSHPFYDKLDTLTTYIDLYHDDKWIWGFRVVNTEIDFNNVKRVECEGYLSFLTDTVLEPFEYQGDIKTLLVFFLKNHNANVEADKRIEVGDVTVYNSTNYINRSSGHRLGTLEAISTRLVDTLDGFLHIEKKDNKLYLHYISVYQNSPQIIRFGENMLSLDNFLRGDTIKTVVIPLGQVLEDEEGINDVSPRLTIESVNDGKNYLINEDAVKKYGYIWSVVEYDDITLPENLKQRGLDYLSQVGDLDVSLEMGAIDLTMLGVSTETFELGQSVRAVSQPHNLDTFIQLSAMVLYLDDPSRNTYVLGTAIQSFAASQVSKEREIDRTIMDLDPYMRSLIDNATALITGGNGGYIYTARNDKGHPSETYYMDTDNIATSKNILRINKNGIGFSINGINGPYRNAWTIDGRLIADFIAAGTIRGVHLEGNTINGGTIRGVRLEGNTISGGTINIDTEVTVGRVINLSPGQNHSGGINLGRTGSIQYSSTHEPAITVTTNNGFSFARIGHDSLLLTCASGHVQLRGGNVFFMVGGGSGIYASVPIVQGSDTRLKENIEEVDLAPLIDEIHIKKFDYLSGITNQVGIIAQSLENSPYRDYILCKDNNDYYAVNYHAITMAAVQKVQKLEQRVDCLEKEMQELKELIKCKK